MRLKVETQGSGLDLVLIHGWGMNGAVWTDLVDRLVANYRVNVIELPGHGYSPYQADMDSLEQWAQACLDAAPERAAWIGWSLGSQVCTQAALLQPERVTHLVSVAGSPRFLQADDWSHGVPGGTLNGFAETLRQAPRLTLERFLALQVRGSDCARAVLRSLKANLNNRPAPQPEALDRGLELLRSTDLRCRLAEISCPALWLLGERDTLTPAAVVEDLAVLIPQAKMQVIKGAAHAPFLSHADEAITALQSFLDE
ncbi:Pimeloyl-[acyl-carrier protein] methyl ester esterase BioH [hydrothermal vent metagenome]|uniref:Pimeloyl-[acyl-carrier protein] methyl ester esterase BioH n=1 Tax=hydrothermal vent metagenome TaxID=652676 RepID=A0A3B1AH73_9ZZZZ